MEKDNAIVIRITNNGRIPREITFPISSAKKKFGIKPPTSNPKTIEVVALNSSYDAFVSFAITSGVDIEKTYIKASSGSQLMQPIKLLYTDVLGNNENKSVAIVKSPMQYQNNVVVIKQNITFDKHHALAVMVESHSFVEFHFYPKKITYGADGINTYVLPKFRVD